MLRVDTDMTQGPGQTLTAIGVRVWSRDPVRQVTYLSQHLDVGSPRVRLGPLVNLMSISPLNGDANRVVGIEVEAWTGSAAVPSELLFVERVESTFVAGQTAYVHVFLPDRCRGVVCPATQYCQPDGSCASVRVTMPDVPSDAGLDAARDAAPCDGGCPAGRACCGLACVDLATTSTHCGACGRACASGTACSAGLCCASGQANCGGVCVNVQTDIAHCGTCATRCTAPAGLCCAGRCTDVLTDEQNCSGCGRPCSAGGTCMTGLCCPAGQTRCGSACVNVQVDGTNCGACGRTCVAPTGSCCAGACFDLTSSAQHCRTCATPCPPGGVCSGAICCPAGQINCGGGCVNTQTDRANCGRCGVQCGAVDSTCCRGACRAIDRDETNCGSCDNVCMSSNPRCCNGNCRNVDTDVNHCGNCATNCSAAQRCVSGTCN